MLMIMWKVTSLQLGTPVRKRQGLVWRQTGCSSFTINQGFRPAYPYISSVISCSAMWCQKADGCQCDSVTQYCDSVTLANCDSVTQYCDSVTLANWLPDDKHSVTAPPQLANNNSVLFSVALLN